MRDAVIVETVRAPVGGTKPGGVLSGIHPVDRCGLQTMVEGGGAADATILERLG